VQSISVNPVPHNDKLVDPLPTSQQRSSNPASHKSCVSKLLELTTLRRSAATEMDNALLCGAYALPKARAITRQSTGFETADAQLQSLNLQLGITDVRFDARH
jgi:hypothetical protein